VKEASGQKLGYFYYEEEPGRRSTAKMLTKDEARRIAANWIQSHPFQMRVSADFLKSIDRWRHLTERLWEIRDVVEVPKAWEQSRAEKFSGDLVLTTRVLDACRPEQDALQRGHPAARGAWLVTRNKITGQISNQYLCPPDLQRKRSASV
jgi:hypothetical protein